MEVDSRRSGERRLLGSIVEVVAEASRANRQASLLNVGAGTQAVLERAIARSTTDFVVDRVDVVDPAVDDEHVRQCWTCSAEAMVSVPSESYDGAFANYVLEHVANVGACADELHRVLRPGGRFAATFPNPRAPEFRLAKHAPMWFHDLFQGGHAFEAHYSYDSVAEVVNLFECSGFRTLVVAYSPHAGEYLDRLGVPLLGRLGRSYDVLLSRLRWSGAMGDVFACFAKR